VIEYQNGRRAWFDGVKDLMKGYLEPSRHGLPTDKSSIMTIWVKDYYSLRQIEGRSAYFVTGSNIMGPMGKELIPFAKESDARGFLKDHAGEKVLRFNQITSDLLRMLD
jgi:nitrous oxide reductase accessory protein NosL